MSEGNYEEAILAFTAAIEIDTKQALAYVGRGDAYIGSVETEETLSVAQADYEATTELDESLAAAYLGLADVYIRRDKYEKALGILQKGLEKASGNQDITDKIVEFESGSIVDSSQHIRRSNTFYLNGALISYIEYDYNELGDRCSWRNYNIKGDGNSIIYNSCRVSFDEKNRAEQNRFF